MAGGVNQKELKDFAKRLSSLSESQRSAVFSDSIRELAMRVLRKVKKRTPVGEYPAESGKLGGTLRRGWKIGEVQVVGSLYEVEVYNNTEYAPYVEFGHRTRSGGWVSGRFMLRISMEEVHKQSRKVVERKLKKMLEEVLNG